MEASWNGATLAVSGNIIVIDGRTYFPPETVDQALLVPSDHRTVCPKKGTARYFHIDVDGTVNENAAWTYADPAPAAAMVSGYIAFWKGVEIG